ncbi:hypothetical protein N5923_05300 [Erwiniaceae bacterium BAC15a-03b]|uniref:Uncharacterized protein n=1 Tax=Winslowiella arboricola TaxID=2978220 RepID=A0A9J6PKB4_9GAMM|nr:hypothetical protein [Winslowiella arboricola]MCU5774152.1 hypothetical protein [Winslowiella arboricola]MCU5776915.1 hypothetical protein [Winslowiella arboricola]
MKTPPLSRAVAVNKVDNSALRPARQPDNIVGQSLKSADNVSVLPATLQPPTEIDLRQHSFTIQQPHAGPSSTQMPQLSLPAGPSSAQMPQLSLPAGPSSTQMPQLSPQVPPGSPQCKPQIKAFSNTCNLMQQRDVVTGSKHAPGKSPLPDYITRSCQENPVNVKWQEANARLAQLLKFNPSQISKSNVLVYMMEETIPPVTSRRAEASGGAEASEPYPPPPHPASSPGTSQNTSAAKHLQFTPEQRDKINRCKAEYFMRLLSCAIRLPVLITTSESNESTVYNNGEPVKKKISPYEISDAISFLKTRNGTSMIIRKAGNDQMRTELESSALVTLLETIPINLFRTTDNIAIYNTFTSTPDILQQQGVAQYTTLHSLFTKGNTLAIKTALEKINVFFNQNPCNSIAKNEFFLTLLLNIKFTLFPEQTRKAQQGNKNHPASSGTAAAAAKRERVTPAQVHFIVSEIEAPPPWAFNAMTAMVIQDKSNIDTLANYLYRLSKNILGNKSTEFSAAFNGIMSIFNDNTNTFFSIAQKMVENVYRELAKESLEEEITQNRLENYFTTFMQATESHTKSEGYKNSIKQVFWPLIYSCEGGFKRYHSEIKTSLSFKHRKLCSIEDRLISLRLTAAFRQPLTWSESIARQFEGILSQAGSDGNRPLATIYFIAFCYERLSREYSEKMFHKFFEVNVKKNERLNAIVMLLLIEVYPPDKVIDIYTDKKEDVVKTFLSYWKKIRSVKSEKIANDKCLIVDQGGAIIEDHKKWKAHIEQRKRVPLALPAAVANRLINKFNFIGNYIFTDNNTIEIVAGILQFLSPMANSEESKTIIDEIASANINSDKYDIHKTANRFQIMLKTTINAINENPLTTKKEREELCNHLTSSVLTLHLNLLNHNSKNIKDELISSISNNFSTISVAEKIAIPLNILNAGLLAEKISEDLYIDIISRTLENSCNQLLDKQTGEIIRTMVLKIALKVIKERDKLFLSLARINTNLASEQSGYNAFLYIVKREMGSTRKPQSSTLPLNNQELQALITFITSSPVCWNIFQRAYTEIYSENAEENNLTEGIRINTEWLINPPCFLLLPPMAKDLMMRFIADVLKQEPANFIRSCLSSIEQKLTTETPINYLNDLEHSLNYLCNALTKESSTTLVSMTDSIFTLAEKINEQKLFRGLSSSMQNALKTILNDIKKTDSLKYDQLSEKYHSLIAASPVGQYFSPPVNVASSSNRIIDTSTGESDNNKPLLPGTSAVAVRKKVSKKKAIVAPTIYVSKNWAELNADADQSKGLHRALEIFSQDPTDSELYFHKYKGYDFWTINIKPVTAEDVQKGWKGTSSDLKIWLFRAEGNCFIVGGVGTHEQAKAESKNYPVLSKKRVSAMIDDASLQYQKIVFNPVSGKFDIAQRDPVQ